MNCAGCGFLLETGFAFCPKCGAKQPKVCAGCGFACAPDFAFCPKCGNGLAADANVAGRPVAPLVGDRHEAAASAPVATAGDGPTGETDADRRTVTVLFADLAGFTSLSEKLDPEVMRRLQNDLFRELTEAVEGYDGFVDKFLGDALLALFGAPVAHEDDPERALRAALDMIERTARISAGAAALTGTPLELHIGVNTGPVVTGGFGAGNAKSYSVTGDTVNTAQRLQSLAAPGEILVGPLTHRLTRHAFAYESLGDLALRGKAGSVLVHRLVSALETPRTARGLEALGLSAPLIGRDGDLGRMLASLERACEGQAQLVRVTGEAGIGKSRLVAEFLARVHDDERFAKVAVRQVACSPLGEESYGALAAVVRSAGGMGRGESADTIREKLGALLVDLGLEGEAGERLKPLLYHVLGFGDLDAALMHVEPEQLRRQILYAVRTIIERRLAMSPLLIVVEDLHWADAISLEALRFVLDRLERTRLMLVVTHRPDLENDQLESTRVSTTTLRLTPLAEAEGHRLLGTLLGERWVSSFADLRDRILSRAGGNPLFVEEIVRGLIDSGVLQRDGAGWQITSEEAVAGIPANIQAMLLARVDRLPVAVRRVAQDAAVIGPRFDMELLATVSAEQSRLETAIELLCDFELIEEMAGAPAGSRSYRFTQSLLRDVIYQNLLVQRRTEMHGRVGAALERLRGANPERLDDMLMLGHHFGLSANREKGARCLMSAGDRARMIYANADALRHYQQALEALAQSALSPIQLQLNERIADLAGAAGKRKFAREHYRMALDAYRANNQCVDAARILRKTGRLLWDWGKRDQAEAAYSDAAALLEGVDAPVERAHLWQERGRLAFRTGDHARAIIWADEALASAAPLLDSGDAENRSEAALVTAEALNTKAVAFARLGRTGEAVREAEQSVTVAEAAELCGAACRGYTNLGVLYTTIDPLRSIEVCRRGLDVARRIGDLGFQARLLANLAVASCTFTDRCSDEGVPAAEKAIEIDRALDQREHLSVPLIVLGQIHQCNGDPALAGRFYGEALEIARQTGEPQLLFPCYDGLATLNLDMDNLAEADRYFALAQDICAKHGLDPEALVVLPFLD